MASCMCGKEHKQQLGKITLFNEQHVRFACVQCISIAYHSRCVFSFLFLSSTLSSSFVQIANEHTYIHRSNHKIITVLMQLLSTQAHVWFYRSRVSLTRDLVFVFAWLATTHKSLNVTNTQYIVFVVPSLQSHYLRYFFFGNKYWV